MTPAHVAHIMERVQDYAVAYSIGSRHGYVDLLKAREDIEAALRDAPQAEPEFYTVFAEHNGGSIPLPGYSNETVKGVKDLVLTAARREGYKGTIEGRLMSLGWRIGPVYAEPPPSAPTAVEPDERAMFEAWYEAHLMPAEADWFRRDPEEPDEYIHPMTSTAWESWQARASKGTP